MDWNGDEDMLNEQDSLARAVRADQEQGFPDSIGRRVANFVIFAMGAGLGMLVAIVLIAADPQIVCRLG